MIVYLVYDKDNNVEDSYMKAFITLEDADKHISNIKDKEKDFNMLCNQTLSIENERTSIIINRNDSKENVLKMIDDFYLKSNLDEENLLLKRIAFVNSSIYSEEIKKDVIEYLLKSPIVVKPRFGPKTIDE